MIKLTSDMLTFICLSTLAVMVSCSNSSQYSTNLTCCNKVSHVALCCPYRNGVCCQDNLHCCPENSLCHPDVNLRMCVAKSVLGHPMTKDLYSSVPLYLQDLNEPPKVEVSTLKRSCPKMSTFCPAPYNGHYCCPVSSGVCCASFRHCCPFNASCDTKTKQCISSTGYKFPWIEKIREGSASRPHIKDTSRNLGCSDNPRCHKQETCCPINSTEYGCCPISDAVCCTGGTQCCPKGSSCNSHNSSCITENKRQFSSIPITRSSRFMIGPLQDKEIKFGEKLFEIKNARSTIICPGGKYSCPGGMSCCPSSTSTYGCCPFPKSVCCSDNWHCCPAGSVCNLEKQTCDRGGLFTPLFQKIKVVKVDQSVGSINDECPDHSECPEGTTCCELPSGSYGCCPLDQAVCCSDKIHCCPYKTICDLEAKGCRAGGNEINWKLYKKIDQLKNTNSSSSLITFWDHVHTKCPSGKYECPDKNTCCKKVDGTWGCCELEQAVCCSDGVHCCPQGYACNLKRQGCTATS